MFSAAEAPEPLPGDDQLPDSEGTVGRARPAAHFGPREHLLPPAPGALTGRWDRLVFPDASSPPPTLPGDADAAPSASQASFWVLRVPTHLAPQGPWGVGAAASSPADEDAGPRGRASCCGRPAHRRQSWDPDPASTLSAPGNAGWRPGDFLWVELGQEAKGSLTLKADTGRASCPQPPAASPLCPLPSEGGRF